jgi:hypothetical protein
MKDQIVIKDWTGQELFRGHYESHGVDEVLDANRCSKCDENIDSDCDYCNGSGYHGDFSVYWLDESDERNVYEMINY